jgi:serine/threonine protein kinase
MSDVPPADFHAEQTGPFVPSEAPLSAEGPFPQAFGRYELRACLGKGGMGTVFLAYDTRLDIEVALKVPHARLLDVPGVLERFYREARAAARLWHPNLCQVLDINEHAGVHYLTMRYIDGVALAERPPPDFRAAAELLRTIALALTEAHRFGIIHRDLNPRNVLITRAGEPVITDFGVALRLGADDDRLTLPGDRVGTPAYMAPEQIDGDLEALCPATDVYALGVMLYWMLCRRLPFRAENFTTLRTRILEGEPARPSALCHDVPLALEHICLKAMARRIPDRYGTACEVADSLTGFIGSPPAGSAHRPLVSRDVLRHAFVGMGEHASPAQGPTDRLYLDVGNDLRPGVLDHHQLTAYTGSTTGLVLIHPELIDAAVVPTRRPGDPFTLVLHEHPDLDCVASAYLATAYLTTGSFPTGCEALGRYVDKVDEGALGLTLSNPYSLYAAYSALANRLDADSAKTSAERWRASVEGAGRLIDHVLAEVRAGQALLEVDAFACPDLLGEADRAAVREDIRCYERKLADPRTHTRQARLRLPGQYGGKVTVEALLVRDVQNADDPERVLFFKDWARSDSRRAGNGRGFLALSVFMSEGAHQVRRCILSLVPDAGASLRGLGALLDQAESERRRQAYGVDDRATDPATGTAKPPRPGYANSDPWYDGRAHGYTIVDSPRGGTLLTAEEIETIFLRFGGAA